MVLKEFDIKLEIKIYKSLEDYKHIVKNLIEKSKGKIKLKKFIKNELEIVINNNVESTINFINSIFDYLNREDFPKNIIFYDIFNLLKLIFSLLNPNNLNKVLKEKFNDEIINILFYLKIIKLYWFRENFTINLNKMNKNFIDKNNTFPNKDIWDSLTVKSDYLLKNRIIILEILNIFINNFNEKEYFYTLLNTKDKFNIKFLYNILIGSLKYDNYSRIPYGHLFFSSNNLTKKYSLQCGYVFNKLFIIEFKNFELIKNKLNEEEINLDYNDIFNSNFENILKELFKKMTIIIRSVYDINGIAFFGSYLANPLLVNSLLSFLILLKNNNFFIGFLQNEPKNYSIIVGLIYLAFNGYHHIIGIKKYIKLILIEIFKNFSLLKKLNYKIEECIEINKLTFKVGFISNFILNFCLIKLNNSINKKLNVDIEIYSGLLYYLMINFENIDENNSFLIFNIIKNILSDFNYIKYISNASSWIKILLGIEKIFLFSFHKNYEFIYYLIMNKNIIKKFSKFNINKDRLKNILNKDKISLEDNDKKINEHFIELKNIYNIFNWDNINEFLKIINNNFKNINKIDEWIKNKDEIKNEFKLINLENKFDWNKNKINFNLKYIKENLEKNLFENYWNNINEYYSS